MFPILYESFHSYDYDIDNFLYSYLFSQYIRKTNFRSKRKKQIPCSPGTTPGCNKSWCVFIRYDYQAQNQFTFLAYQCNHYPSGEIYLCFYWNDNGQKWKFNIVCLLQHLNNCGNVNFHKLVFPYYLGDYNWPVQCAETVWVCHFPFVSFNRSWFARLLMQVYFMVCFNDRTSNKKKFSVLISMHNNVWIDSI